MNSVAVMARQSIKSLSTLWTGEGSAASSTGYTLLTPSPATTTGINDGLTGQMVLPNKANSTQASRALLQLLDDQLKDIKPIQKLSEISGIRIAFLFLGFCGALLFSVQFGRGNTFILDCVGFLFPAWMSFKALEFNQEEDKQFWLCYWVSFAAFSIAEYLFNWLLFWIPLYYMLKLLFILWLYLPWFKGANMVYDLLIRPQLWRNYSAIEDTVDAVTTSFRAAVGAVAEPSIQRPTKDENSRENIITSVENLSYIDKDANGEKQ